jgi:hypothetical protein
MTDVLIFTEDPGAVNFVADVPAALARRGWRSTMLADGLAPQYLAARGIPFEVVGRPVPGRRLIAEMAPRVLVVGTSENPHTQAFTLLEEARHANTASVGVVDARTNADRRFRGGSSDPLRYAPDWLLVPDTPTGRAFVALGYPEHRLVVCGHPHYDYVRQVRACFSRQDRDALKRRLFPGAAGRQVVMFATEGSIRVAGHAPADNDDYTFRGAGSSIGRTEIVLEEFLRAVESLDRRPYLVLRLHPKDTIADYQAYLGGFDLVSSSDSPLELLYAADLVVGLTSMLLAEACLLERPTLSVVPRETEKTWLATIEIGATPCVTTQEEIAPAIAAILRAGATSRAKADAFFPSGALDRTADAIERALERC